MQKTVQITLDGQIFFIEEEAYQKLEEYLESIKTLFIHDEDQQDIINDIEARIAEIFLEQLSNKKQSLSISDINLMISQMGDKQDFMNEDTTNSSQETHTFNQSDTSNKKLFRDPDDVVLAGVCSGIAAYFGLDPVLIRILFGISIFVYGWGILFYLFLAIIIPKAENTSDKLRMKGKPVNLKKIEDEVKQSVQRLRQKKSSDDTSSRINDLFNFISSLFQGVIALLSKVIPFISKLIGIVIIIVSVALIGIWSFLATTILFNSNAPWIDQSLISTIPQPELYILIVCAYFAFMIPTIAITCLGVAMIKQKKIFSTAGIIVATIAWFIAISVGGAIGTRVFPDIQKSIKSFEESYNSTKIEKIYDITDFTKIDIGGNRKVRISQADDYFVKIIAPQTVLERENVSVVNKELRIDRSDILCFFCFEPYSDVIVEIQLPDLTKVDFSGAVSADILDFDLKELEIELSGASNLDANINASFVIIDLSGSSDVKLNGESNNTSIELSGASKVNGIDYKTSQVIIDMSGASQTQLQIIDSVIGDLSGASKLKLIGEPNSQSIETSGASTVTILKKDKESNLINESTIEIDF
jgi:phage shock protein PspC (stress-responsive transcriptional regulator)